MCRLFLLGVLLALSAVAQTGDAPAVPAPQAEAALTKGPAIRVVLIGGINKDPEEIRLKDKNVMQLSRYFRGTLGVPAQDLFVLTQDNSFVSDRTGRSDAATITRVLTGLAQKETGSTTIVYYTGQANLVGDQLRFNIPGPDMTHEEFAGLIKVFGNTPMCIILDCPGAGLAAKALAGPNRILVYAARSDQPTSTRFSDFFVPALEDTASDLDGDGRVSLVEAFQISVQQIDAVFRDQGLLKSETALLDDDGDGVPSQHPWGDGEAEKDGKMARHLYMDTWRMVYSVTQDREPEESPP